MLRAFRPARRMGRESKGPPDTRKHEDAASHLPGRRRRGAVAALTILTFPASADPQTVWVRLPTRRSRAGHGRRPAGQHHARRAASRASWSRRPRPSRRPPRRPPRRRPRRPRRLRRKAEPEQPAPKRRRRPNRRRPQVREPPAEPQVAQRRRRLAPGAHELGVRVERREGASRLRRCPRPKVESSPRRRTRALARAPPRAPRPDPQAGRYAHAAEPRLRRCRCRVRRRRRGCRTSSSASSGCRRSCCRSIRPPGSSTASAGRCWRRSTRSRPTTAAT